MSAPEGLLLLDKPAGITSHDLVNRVRSTLGTRKVGHAGTLDPMATGLMLVGVGRGTRLLRYLSGLDKTYEGALRLGETTDTLDADGQITHTAEVAVTRQEVAGAAAAMVGESLQRPPAYSAVKVEGRKLYEAARAGEELEAEPRRIHVESFDVTTFDGHDASFVVSCSSGTYVRVLGADLGAALGCGAHLVSLRRTRIGPYEVSVALQPDDEPVLLPVERMVDPLVRRELTEEEAVAVSYGRPLAALGTPGPVAVFDSGGRLLAVYRDRGDAARAEMVLPSAQAPEPSAAPPPEAS